MLSKMYRVKFRLITEDGYWQAQPALDWLAMVLQSGVKKSDLSAED